MRRVLHVGPLANTSGGISQVVATYEQLPIGLSQSVAVSTMGVRGIREVSLVFRTILAIVFSPRSTIVIVHMSQGGAMVREGTLAWVSRLSRHRTLAMMHGSSLVSWGSRHPGWVRYAVFPCHLCLVLTDEAESFVSSLLRRSRVIVVPNPVALPPSVPAMSDRDLLAVFAGTVGYRKGVDVLAEAWGRSQAKGRGWRLVIYGPVDGSIPPLPPQDGINVAGEIQHDELLVALQSARLAILPSRAEALPMFLLEAMAAGCVPIGTRVGQVEHLIGDSGRVTESGDPTALASALDSLTEVDDAKLEELSEEARRSISAKYSLEAAARRLETVWIHL